jgi:hypothetical protein
MHVQMVTFTLNGITEEQYHEACAAETESFAALPGLLSKIWLRSPESDTYGGVYLWRDRDCCQAYLDGNVFSELNADPSLTNVRSRDFDVFQDLTKATQPGLAII